MIKENELRIGNLVQYTGGNYFDDPAEIITVHDIPFDGINLASIESARYPFEQLDGIPLTEEWLLKFGFEKDVVEDTYSKTIGGRVTFALEKQPYIDGSYDWHTLIETNVGMGYNSLIRPPIYVHELQNLVFAMTGEELTYTSPPQSPH